MLWFKQVKTRTSNVYKDQSIFNRHVSFKLVTTPIIHNEDLYEMYQMYQEQQYIYMKVKFDLYHEKEQQKYVERIIVKTHTLPL